MLEVDQQHIKVIHYYHKIGFYALLVAAGLHAIFIFMFKYFSITTLAWVNLFSVLLYWYCLVLFPKAKKNLDFRLIGWLVYTELIVHGVVACYYLGLESGFQYYVFLLAIFPFLNYRHSLEIRTVKVVFLVVVCLLLDYWLHKIVPVVAIDPIYLNLMRLFNLSVFLIVTSIVSYFFAQASKSYQRSLYIMATIDQLTGLHNRRYLIEAADREIAEQQRNGRQVSLLILDIDYFKRVNDKYGHNTGDEVLKCMADVLRTYSRQSSVVARWGGEEFLILLPNTDAATMGLIAERIRKKIAKSQILYNNYSISITVTIGGASLHPGERFAQLLTRADDALYQGKDRGRDCYVLSQEQTLADAKPHRLTDKN